MHGHRQTGLEHGMRCAYRVAGRVTSKYMVMYGVGTHVWCRYTDVANVTTSYASVKLMMLKRFAS